MSTHISDAITDETSSSYSITQPIYKILYYNFCGNIAICVFLTIMNLLSIFVTKKFLDFHIKEKNDFLNWIYAIVLNFVTPILLPFLDQDNWNVGFQSPTIWHNSTYQCMKVVGLLSMLYYFKIQKNYLKEIKIHNYILFILLLTLTNSVKPNFIIIFAPTMAICLTIDFIKNIRNKSAILHIFIFGFAVLISLIVLVYQSIILYSGSDGSGIEFGFMTVLSYYTKYPILSIIQSAAFPFYILITNFKKIIKNQEYFFVFLMYIISLFEYLFINETGPRKYHGNFSWSIYFATFMSFVSSVAILENLRNEDIKNKKIYLIIGYLLLIIHFGFGSMYFYRLLRGVSFF